MSIMKITKIERQRKFKERFSVFINGEFSFGISEEELIKYDLSEDSQISEQLYNRIMDSIVLKRAKFLALNYLSYKNRTEKEVRDKLRSYHEFSDNVIDVTIDELKNIGFIDDCKYAEMFALSKANNHLDGYSKIKHMLYQRGVSLDISLDELGIDEVCNAVKLIEKKVRYKDELDYSEKKKVFAYLVRKGYSYSVIGEAFKRYEEEMEWE